MIDSPWRPLYRRVVQAAIRADGVRGRVVRIVTHNPDTDRYQVYLAQGGQIGRRMAVGYGTPDHALLAGCADMYEIDKPHLWRQKRITE